MVYDELDDTKEMIGICKLKKDRHYNGQSKKDKRTNNDLQNIKPKTKDQATRTALKSADELRFPGRVNSSTRSVTLVTNPAW